MTNITEVKILRLVTGEDIIAKCIFDDETNSILVDYPMRIGMSRPEQTKISVMVLASWLPVEVLDVNSTYINQNDVITVMNPKQSMVEYYLNLVEEESNGLKSESVSEEDYFDGEEDREEDDPYDDDMFSLKDMLFESKVQKKTNYH